MSAILALGAHMRDRFEEKGAQHGLAYPWWIAFIGGGGQVLCVAVAVGQRGLFTPPEPATLALVLADGAAGWPQYVAERWVPWWVDVVFMLAAVGWLMTIPFDGAGSGEPGPGGGDLPRRLGDRHRRGTCRAPGRDGRAIVVVVGSDRIGGPDPSIDIYVVEIIGGFVVGYMLRWQMRALAAETQRARPERERATLAERQRIAREIHDLVAHSLSVTMLHVTGAKQALVEDNDVDDAVAALADAEQVGRQAMAEIRRTVCVLATEPTGAHPLPCAEDIDALVAQVRDAGLPVDYTSRGDLTRLSPAIGLGMYRILQESLTNVAKHAPGETAQVRRRRSGGPAPRSSSATGVTGAPSTPDGSGTSGMASRAEQIGGTFRVGPDEVDPRAWVVDLDVPVDDAHCVVKKVLG